MTKEKKFFRRHLMVKGKYVDLILHGKKVTTIRKGYWIPKSKEIILHGGGKPFAVAEITNVVYKKVSELSNEDAIKDGLRNKEELLEELRKVYGEVSPDDLVTIIEFKVTKKLTELDLKDPYMGLKPVEVARLALRYLKDLSDEEKKILRVLTQAGSLREAAIRLYGDIGARWRIRRVLRKSLHEMVKRGILKPSHDLKKESE